MYIIIHNHANMHYTPLYTTYIRYTWSSIGGSYATKAKVSTMVCSESSMRWPFVAPKKMNSSEKHGRNAQEGEGIT